MQGCEITFSSVQIVVGPFGKTAQAIEEKWPASRGVWYSSLGLKKAL
jgi:hypothetical protein